MSKIIKKFGIGSACAVLVAGVSMQQASAAMVYADLVTTDGGSFNAKFSVENLMDESVTGPDSALSATVAAANIAYATAEPPTAGYPVTITFDFTNAIDLDAMFLWNNATNATIASKGIKDFSLKFYDGAGATGTQLGTTYSSSAAQAVITGTYTAETFDLGAGYSGVRSVELIVANNHLGSSWVGAREIAFNEVESSQVPEPASLTLLGLGGVTLLLRRKK